MSVKSAERVLRVFELFSQYRDGLTIKEISEKLSFPQSSTSGLIGTLFKEGYLSLDSFNQYKLGPKLIQIGSAALESLDISKQALPYLKRLMEDVQETVFMALLSEKDLVYVAKIDNNRSIRTTAQPGSHKPLYCTGLGKAFLAFMNEQQKNQILDSTEYFVLRVTRLPIDKSWNSSLISLSSWVIPSMMRKMKRVILYGGSDIWSG